MRDSAAIFAAFSLIALGACSDRAQTQADAAGDDAMEAAKHADDAIETIVKDTAGNIEETADTTARKAGAASDAAAKTE